MVSCRLAARPGERGSPRPSPLGPWQNWQSAFSWNSRSPKETSWAEAVESGIAPVRRTAIMKLQMPTYSSLFDAPLARMEPTGPAFGRPDDKHRAIRDSPSCIAPPTPDYAAPGRLLHPATRRRYSPNTNNMV